MASENTVLAASDEDKSVTPVNVFGQNAVLLPETFQPGQYDVICGRGRKCFNHEGNARFRELVASYLEKYSDAEKLDKSNILSEIVNKVRQESPTGGFVKKDSVTGRWQAVGDFLAREKTSQAFRDSLHDQYKSSNASKKKRRQAEQAVEKDLIDHSQNSFVCPENSVYDTENSYLPSRKFMRVERYSGHQASLLGALDDDLAAQFGGTRSKQNSASQYVEVESSQKYMAHFCEEKDGKDLYEFSPKSVRSLLDVGRVSSGAGRGTTTWFSQTAKPKSFSYNTASETEIYQDSSERSLSGYERSDAEERRAERSDLLRLLRSKFLASDDIDDDLFESDRNLVSHGLD